MTQNYTLAAALLRRGRVDLSTLEEVERRVRREQALDDLLFTPEILDLAPDIFPPHLVGGFIEQNNSQGFRKGDTYQTYLQKMTRGRKRSTLRMISRQLHSAAKADATRRTTSVHPVNFNGVPRIKYGGLDEQYFIFPELYAEARLQEIQGTLIGERVHQAIERYRTSRGTEVPVTFFEMIDRFKEIGLSPQRDVKHKYPIHGLLYGSAVEMPEDLRLRMEQIGQVVLQDLVVKLSTPEEALCFSLDFFLGPTGSLFVGRDVHEQQIGMGLQFCLGVDSSAAFYTTYTKALAEHVPGKRVALSYDPTLCQKNRLYQMELAALRQNLEFAGFQVKDNLPGSYTIRLFGGKEGIPGPSITKLTDDKLLIDDILEQHREEFIKKGVIVPATYRCTAADLMSHPEEVTRILGSEKVFVHPTVHHGFKPFELDLASCLSKTIIQETFTKLGGPALERIPLVVMERVPNRIEFDGKDYAHEVRAYFVLGG